MRGWACAAAVVALGVGVVASSANAAPMTFALAGTGGNCADCSWIAADGDITSETPKDLRAFLKANEDSPTLLMINSLGGDLAAGMELGEAIRALKLEVRVGKTKEDSADSVAGGMKIEYFEGGICASACVFALMGGAQRTVADDDSEVRIHQFRLSGDRMANEAASYSTTQTAIAATSSTTQSAVGALYQYAVKMGVDPAVIGWMAVVPPDTTRRLSVQEMESAKLLTSRTAPIEAPWQLKPDRKALAATAEQAQGDGRQIDYSLTCKLFDVLIPLPTGFYSADESQLAARAKELAGLLGEQHGWDPGIWSGDDDVVAKLEFLSAVGDKEGIHLSFSNTAALINLVAKSKKSLWLNFGDAPNFAWSELNDADHGGFLLPRSNLSEMEFQLNRSCADSAH